jgi:hypothetical protein
VTLHQERTHPIPVDGCAPCRWSSIQLTPAATPSRVGDARQYAFQRRFAAEFHNGDREAYRRLRANGVQPPTIAGSAELERHASTRFEIESGRIDPDQRKLKTALTLCDDVGFDPLSPVTTTKAAN